MAVPMRFRDRNVGLLFLEHGEPNTYSEHHADLALAIAQQAAIAIENARLYAKAQEVAVLEERQRLSRELHDSVSQALYGIGIGAQTTRILLERDPAQAVRSNEYVLSLAEVGLAEMRALIFELRPESLETEGIAAALQKQAAARRARHRILVETTLCDEPSASLPIKEALYRIAQEALQNIVKHAQATQVRLALTCSDAEIELEVRDNGKGFDPHGSFPGHLGLSSMRERVERLGGKLELESAVGAGTMIRARLPMGGSETVHRAVQQ
jgi:signal transduction histidine kinase